MIMVKNHVTTNKSNPNNSTPKSLLKKFFGSSLLGMVR
jgi:hypothetical protein